MLWIGDCRQINRTAHPKNKGNRSATSIGKGIGKIRCQDIQVNANSLTLGKTQNFKTGQIIDTYHDHRMAMAFAPLALRVPLTINDAGVVSPILVLERHENDWFSK